MRIIHLKTADEIFTTLRLSNGDLFGTGAVSTWVFRGHSDPEWRLIPSLWRDKFSADYDLKLFRSLAADAARVSIYPGHPWGKIGNKADVKSRYREVLYRLLIEEQLRANFAALASEVGQPGFQSELRSNLTEIILHPDRLLSAPFRGTWAAAQHYGLPTRLLDWTLDPLVAVYFAVGDARAGLGRGDVYALNADRNKPEFDHAGPWGQLSIHRTRGASDPRLTAQRGAFTFAVEGDRRYVDTGAYPAVDELVPSHTILRFSIELSEAELAKVTTALVRERRTKAHLMTDLATCGEVAAELLRTHVRL